jgi:hypothetical protein
MFFFSIGRLDRSSICLLPPRVREFSGTLADERQVSLIYKDVKNFFKMEMNLISHPYF